MAIAAILLPPSPGTKGSAAHAVSNTILQPTSVTSSLDESPFISIHHLINQTGLSSSYISEVERFMDNSKNMAI